MKSELIERAASDLLRSGRTVALTGAGISVESGIPPFRGKGGLWEKVDPMEFGHIEMFERDPAKVWQILIRDLKSVIDRAEPNDAHAGLAKLERMGLLEAVITQNVDGLHQMAGSSDVVEFHGNAAWQRCMDCGTRIPTREIDVDALPPRCACNGVLRPDWVFFGEMIPADAMNRSRALAARCDVMLVIGTSAIVQPAAYMPVIAKQSGATVIEINPEATALTRQTSDYLVQGPAGAVMNALLAAIEARRS